MFLPAAPTAASNATPQEPPLQLYNAEEQLKNPYTSGNGTDLQTHVPINLQGVIK